MAFNVHVRNYQHAAAYFWSAPKEVKTQLRPGTWGQIHLDPSASPAKGYGPVDNTTTRSRCDRVYGSPS